VTAASTRTVVLERLLQASPAQVWRALTTKAGLETWWGPEGFTTQVHELDLRPGGQWRYTMTASDRAMVEFMRRAGMPLTHEVTATYTEVVPRQRLRYAHRIDFVPGVAPYETAALIELHAAAQQVRLVVSLDAMHDELWTARAREGWDSQLGRLLRQLASAV
jgi:uncharacterized protein YndB with AHSA1/START domain